MATVLLANVFVIIGVHPLAQAVPPVTLDRATVQVNVVPETRLVIASFSVVPLQITPDDGVTTTTGLGFTVSFTVIELPTHPPAVAVGVTV